MAKLIKFPINTPPAPTAAIHDASRKGIIVRVAQGFWQFIWVVFVLVWPLLKWPFAIYVFFRLVQMFYYWNVPTVHATWLFLAHFAVFVLCTYFVSAYKPKGL